MQRSKLFLLGLCLTFCFFSSCVIAVVEYSDEGIPVLDKFQRVIPLDFGGTLSLENIKGDIEISGWDREEVEVYAEKMFPRSLKKRVHIFRRRISTPKIDIDKFEDFIKIKTLEEEGSREIGRVDYYIKVPQSIILKDISTGEGEIIISDLYGELSVDLKYGNLIVENYSGTLTAYVDEGSVRTSLVDLREKDEINITVEKGDMVVYLSEEASVKIEGSAPNGDIFSEFELDQPTPSNKVSAEIGQNGAFLSLRASNGNIRIRKE